ncbi:MAG: hypothetical protein LBR18_08550 [Tannerella sp.]|jgi:hypothetical protein|nr:hypothetical protein [Tannerella sp.]
MKKVAFIFFLTTAFPALVGAQSSFSAAPTPEEIFSSLPDIPGWTKPTDKEVFDSENLFDRINGAAPLFIESGFCEMTTFDYTKGNDYITVQVYRHATPQDAFGMYAAERSPELTFYKIGGEAHGNNESLFFFSGVLYVKMQSNAASENVNAAMCKIAESIAAKIDKNQQGYPSLFNVFPDANKIEGSEMYVTSSYIGHDFLNKVYACRYKTENLKYQLFIIDMGNADAAKEIMKKYLEFAKQDEPLQEGGVVVIKDRYNGDVPMRWAGRFLFGVYNENGEPTPNASAILQNFTVL